MKVIMLDIDGVLNWEGTEDRIDGFVGLDSTRIANFNRLIEAHPDAKIVISSTWRHCSIFMTAYQDFEGLKKLLASRGLKGEIIGYTPMRALERYGRNRGGEIKSWLDQNPDWTKFVVLDDDASGMHPLPVPTKQSWHTDEEFDTEVLLQQSERDLRPNHVRTSFRGVKRLVTDETYQEGGLSDGHIDLAIKVLNGYEIPVDND